MDDELRAGEQRIEGQVAAIEPVTHDIRIIRVAPPAQGRFAFRAGQYARVRFGASEWRDYSIASVPGAPFLEFHVRNKGQGPSRFICETLGTGDPVSVIGPRGEAFLRPDAGLALLAIAGGSGLAPMKAIVESALAARPERVVALYFGARAERDVYLADHFSALERAHPHFRFEIVLSEPGTGSRRRQGLVGAAAAADLGAPDSVEAYVAGPPPMVEHALALLTAAGVPPGRIHSDAFYTEAQRAARQA